MVKYVAAVLFLVGLMAACKSTPKDVLDEEKMIAVWVDIHIAEGRVKTVGIFGDSAKKITPVLYKEVYAKHQITAEEFQRSYRFYQTNPEKFEQMIDKVITELSKQESGIKPK